MYDFDLEDDARVNGAVRKVMEKMRKDISHSIKVFGSMDELTESGEAAVNLMKTHLNLLDMAGNAGIAN